MNESATDWDVIVIGGGPAGSTAAIQAARAGLRVLLVDRNRFPRAKVCGCCLSGKALRLLHELQLQDVVSAGIPLQTFQLGCGGRSVPLTVTGGRAISRNLLDHELLQVAAREGVSVETETTAQLGSVVATSRQVVLTRQGTVREVAARVVLICSGLGNGTLRQSLAVPETVQENPLVGITAIVPGEPAFAPGIIWMAVHAAGYVGLTVLEDGRLNVSGAVRKAALKQAGRPERLAATILAEAAIPVPADLSTADWMGTRELTRQLVCPAAERVFILGDAAGYVEPFTGQGMAWAIAAAQLVQPFVRAGVTRWREELQSEWTATYRRLMRTEQQTCHWMAYFSSRPHLVRSAIGLLRYAPGLARPVVRSIHGNSL